MSSLADRGFPPPYADSSVYAGMEHGRRMLLFTLPGPGRLHRNPFDRAWLTVTERVLWRGEPLDLSARRLECSTSAGRGFFTDTADKLIGAELFPAIAKAGFDEIWTYYHGTRAAEEGGQHEANRSGCLAAAQWWADRAELSAAHGRKDLSFVPVPEGRQTVLSYNDRPRDEDVIAKAVLDGERVGWLTRAGDLIPHRGSGFWNAVA